MKRFLIALVRAYQRWISPLFPPSCRFRPTCSVYMIQAIEMHGLKGVLMGVARILRCHPLSETGDDPVPDYFSLKRNKTPLDKLIQRSFSMLKFLTKFLAGRGVVKDKFPNVLQS